MSRGSHGPVVRRRTDWVAMLSGLIIFTPCAVLAHSGTTGSLERRVFHLVNDLPGWLSPAMRSAQLLGVLAVGPVFALGALALRRPRLALAALLVIAGKLVAERMVWHFVHRSRPGSTIADAIVRGGSPTTGFAFVSGHVVLLTGLAWVATPYLSGRWRVVPWVIVALVAFARVYLGAHAPLDVLGGFGVGLVVGAFVNLIVGMPEGSGALRRRGSREARRAS